MVAAAHDVSAGGPSDGIADELSKAACRIDQTAKDPLWKLLRRRPPGARASASSAAGAAWSASEKRPRPAEEMEPLAKQPLLERPASTAEQQPRQPAPVEHRPVPPPQPPPPQPPSPLQQGRPSPLLQTPQPTRSAHGRDGNQAVRVGGSPPPAAAAAEQLMSATAPPRPATSAPNGTAVRGSLPAPLPGFVQTPWGTLPVPPPELVPPVALPWLAHSAAAPPYVNHWWAYQLQRVGAAPTLPHSMPPMMPSSPGGLPAVWSGWPPTGAPWPTPRVAPPQAQPPVTPPAPGPPPQQANDWATVNSKPSSSPPKSPKAQ
jgi:hypothetical protein